MHSGHSIPLGQATYHCLFEHAVQLFQWVQIGRADSTEPLQFYSFACSNIAYLPPASPPLPKRDAAVQRRSRAVFATYALSLVVTLRLASSEPSSNLVTENVRLGGVIAGVHIGGTVRTPRMLGVLHRAWYVFSSAIYTVFVCCNANIVYPVRTHTHIHPLVLVTICL